MDADRVFIPSLQMLLPFVFIAQMLYKSVQGTLDENSVVSTRATPGQDWVRGWDDLKRGPLTPSEPAQE